MMPVPNQSAICVGTACPGVGRGRLDIISDLKAAFSLFPWLPTTANFLRCIMQLINVNLHLEFKKFLVRELK